jgi:hypothetical protein
MKVVDIQLQKTDPAVITSLEEGMQYAKTHNVANAVIVMVGEDGTVMDCWATKRMVFQMVGGIESIKLEFMMSCIEGRDG